MWHIRLALGIQGLIPGQGFIRAYENLYIATSDYTPRQGVISETITYPGQINRVKLVETFSKWGEPLRIALPAACRGKG